jgi:hypothetical protein
MTKGNTMEKGLSKNQILSELSRSPHGKLDEYVAVGLLAAKQEPEFLAHLISWDHEKGQVRDAKVALPIVSIKEQSYPDEFVENSLANLADLGPREILKAYRFALDLRAKNNSQPHRMRLLRKMIETYLHEEELEAPTKWDRLAIQHRHTLHELYALTHTKPSPHAQDIIFKGEHPKGSIFDAVAQLGNMSSSEAAGTIMEWRIPFLIALGALGKKAKEPDLVLALINRMTPTELITNTKMLEKLGVSTNPALKGAYQEGLKKAQSSTKNVLKTTRAAENIQNEELKANLQGVQDKQLASMAVEGNWLVLGDRSGSMQMAIEVAREVATTLSKMVKGKVWMVFFNTAPQTIDVTGAPLDVIKKATQYIRAEGRTSIGCGLMRMLEAKEEIDGIAIVSDGGDNTVPFFHDAYKKYSDWAGKEVPVYHYHVNGDPNHLKGFCQSSHIDLQEFDLTGGVDFYSLPNLVRTMRTNRYSLVDEVMSSKLLTLKDVFKKVDVTHFMRKEVKIA